MLLPMLLTRCAPFQNDFQPSSATRTARLMLSTTCSTICTANILFTTSPCNCQEPALDWATFANSKQTQVEHIWARGQQWLGDKKKTHEKNVNRLGNLTVTHFNQKLGKKPFKEKKKLSPKPSLVIENTFQKHRDWTLTLIARRESRLVNFVLNRWPTPKGGPVDG